MLAAVCEACGRMPGMSWPGAVAAIGVAFAIAFAIWAAAKYVW